MGQAPGGIHGRFAAPPDRFERSLRKVACPDLPMPRYIYKQASCRSGSLLSCFLKPRLFPEYGARMPLAIERAERWYDRACANNAHVTSIENSLVS